VAAVATVLLAGCGGSSDDPSEGAATKAPSSAAATSDAPKDAEATGSFQVSGAVSGQGSLSDIVCAPAEGGIQVTAAFSASGKSGTLTVVSGGAPEDADRGDKFTIEGGDARIYNRVEADGLPYDIVDDGSKVTGSVVLADIRDVVKPDVKDRKQVKLTVDVDCGTS
jgi:hypothetical protein